MRIEQLILSTRSMGANDSAPPIVSDANIKLLFDMQGEVDSLTAAVAVCTI